MLVVLLFGCVSLFVVSLFALFVRFFCFIVFVRICVLAANALCFVSVCGLMLSFLFLSVCCLCVRWLLVIC